MNQDVLHIQKIAPKADPNGPIRFAVPAVSIQTPQGKRLIPNPTGRESWVFETLEEAQQAVLHAGFAAEFEGEILTNQPQQQASRFPVIRATDGNLDHAIPLLIERLKDREADVVAHSALALGSLQATQAINPLCQLIAHEDGTVRKHIAESLSRMGHHAIPQLKDAWEKTQSAPNNAKTPYAKLTLITACNHWAIRMRQLPGPLLQMTMEALNDNSWLVRSQAALAIANAAAASIEGNETTPYQ